MAQVDIEEFETLGRAWIRNAIPTASLDRFARLCEVGSRPGMRLGLTDELRAHIGALSPLIESFGVDLSPVRLVSFNKSAAANWSVPWHQDRVIAIAKQRDVIGYSNWIPKEGFWHCEPPLEILKGMIFVRVHFDDCGKANGAMELALGSHRRGLVEAARARAVAETSEIEVCEAEAGDVLVAKALILHRSSTATKATSRRALRIDYARTNSLSPELDWAFSTAPQ